jgi:hypothetical protein
MIPKSQDLQFGKSTVHGNYFNLQLWAHTWQGYQIDYWLWTLKLKFKLWFEFINHRWEESEEICKLRRNPKGLASKVNELHEDFLACRLLLFRNLFERIIETGSQCIFWGSKKDDIRWKQMLKFLPNTHLFSHMMSSNWAWRVWSVLGCLSLREKYFVVPKKPHNF